MDQNTRHSAVEQDVRLLHQLFERQVQETPHAIAVEWGEESLSYAQLNAQANQLAGYLIQKGVKRETIVALYLERGIEQIVATFGVLKAGGAFLSMEVNHPLARLESILHQAGARYILTTRSQAHHWDGFSGEVLCIDLLDEVMEGMSPDDPGVPLHPLQLAYVIFTSGSTNQPKGVMVPHRGAVHYLMFLRERYSFGDETIALQLASYSFDASVRDIFLPLMVGGKIVLLSPSEAKSPQDILFRIKNHRVNTILSMVPTTLRTLLSEWEYAPVEGAQLKRLFVSGEVLTATDCAALRKIWGDDLLLVNQYGPTETTMVMTNYIVPKQGWNEEVSIGKPIDGMRVYICDASLNLVPPGTEGELYISGVGVTRGYIGQSGQTAQAFLPDPFASEPGARMYRTGDWGRVLPDGSLQFRGRKDWQVKIQGNRVELGEIEASLQMHPEVLHAVVDISIDENQQQLIAYIVPKPNCYLRVEQLLAFLAHRLPTYMLPQEIFFLESLPLTASGKVNRKALPKPMPLRQRMSATSVAPRDELEGLVATVWCQVLKTKRVGVEDNFFSLGGHSLLATQVVLRLRDACGFEIPLSLFFENPTVHTFAQALRHHGVELPERTWESSLNAQAAIKRNDTVAEGATQQIEEFPYPRPEHLPAAPNQQHLWFIQNYFANSTAYNLPRAYWLRGNLDLQALKHALEQLAERHEVLRTSFYTHEGGLFQKVRPSIEINFRVDDVRNLPYKERKAKALRTVEAAIAQPFDLGKSPLWRVGLIRLSEDFYVLYFVFHHIIMDAWSVDLFIRELNAIYQAELLQTPALLPKLCCQYADFALWQHALRQQEKFKQQVDFWLKKLSGVPEMLPLPLDHPRPGEQTLEGASLYFEVPEDVTHAMREFAKASNVTLFQCLLACFYVLLYRLTEMEDLVVGVPIAYRERKEFEPLLGFFVHTLALRLKLVPTMNFRELVAQVQKVVIEAFTHQDASFEHVLEALRPLRNPAVHPIFQTMFAFQSVVPEQLALSNTVSDLVSVERGISRFDLVMSFWEQKDTLMGKVEYKRDLFEEKSIQRWVDAYQTLLRLTSQHSDFSLATLPVMPPQQMQHLIRKYNQTAYKIPLNRTVLDEFNIWVESTPQEIALVYREQSLTYAALERQANILAHYLQSCGVGQEEVVAICLPRCAEWVVAMLAIWKVGAAYVPLNPGLPPKRIEYLLRDARARLVITNRGYAPLVSQGDNQTILIEEAKPENRDTVAPVSVRISSAQAAYVIYTSGSTGEPKGVVVTHHGLYNLVEWHRKNFTISNRDKATQIASYSFDASVWEIWPYLCAGACVYILDEEVRMDVKALMDYWQKHRITMAFLPTPLTEALFSMPLPEGLALRYLLTGGEQLHRQPPEGLPFALVNNYGPTECSVVSSSIILSAAPSSELLPPIGYPIANTRIYILDKLMQPVIEGVLGEIYIAGDGLSRGYLNRAAMTASSFFPDPFRGDGSRMYRTGDMGRYRHDGSLEFVRRRDNQVKLRGYRIELGEIEQALLLQSEVSEAVVVLQNRDTPLARLVAFIKLRLAHTLTQVEISARLRSRLPSYMLPTHLVFVEELPLNSSGKVDRKKLEEFPIEDVPLELSERMSKAVEQVVARIWKNVLNISEISPQQNFFDLGGHSLLAMRLSNILEELFGVQFPVGLIFENPTVAGISQQLEKKFADKESLERFSALILEEWPLEEISATER